MRRTKLILALPLLLAAMFFAGCPETDPKALTDRATTAVMSGDWKGGLADFDAALAHMDATSPVYIRASVGRCKALAHLQPTSGKDAFLALVKSQGSKLETQDFQIVASEYVVARQFSDAIDVMHAGMEMFPANPKMVAIKDFVVAESRKAGDPALDAKLRGLGYIGKD